MGAYLSAFRQTFPGKPKFDIDRDVPDLSGKVMIVTGATTGIGKEIAKGLLRRNAKVYITAKSHGKAEGAIADLEKASGKKPEYLILDLADLNSVKVAAEDFLSKETQIHVLFKNAGVQDAPIDWLTAQGYDLHIGTNVLGHFYFTHLLLPTLLSTAKSLPEGKTRVINTSSSTHLQGGLDYTTFRDGKERRKLSSRKLYGQSKFGTLVFGKELARRYGDQGIVSVAVNPGSIQSDIRRYTPRLQRWINQFSLHPTPYGAVTQLWAGTTLEGLDMNGKYGVPWAREGPPRKDAEDPEVGRKFWEWMDDQVKEFEVA
ncbi:NAD(P)-binding protein [Heliocybe sulcata]|uniref:NAD(P)-binding protein n=1 Tax=Heliocybe sulcata TaxID=5364 RepID=A0A5C3MRS6_9AGAM|nr:NAD(P)-binding protein [Heliocybe sulcata]